MRSAPAAGAAGGRWSLCLMQKQKGFRSLYLLRFRYADARFRYAGPRRRYADIRLRLCQGVISLCRRAVTLCRARTCYAPDAPIWLCRGVFPLWSKTFFVMPIIDDAPEAIKFGYAKKPEIGGYADQPPPQSNNRAAAPVRERTQGTMAAARQGAAHNARNVPGVASFGCDGSLNPGATDAPSPGGAGPVIAGDGGSRC